MPMMGWGSLSRCSAGISIGPEGVVVFPERAEPVGEPEVHEAHLGLEVGILDGTDQSVSARYRVVISFLMSSKLQ